MARVVIVPYAERWPAEFARGVLGERALRIDADHEPPGAETTPGDWTKRLFQNAPDERAANIHVRLEGRPNARYALLFRDYLRAHPAAAAAYADLKRRLAAELPASTATRTSRTRRAT